MTRLRTRAAMGVGGVVVGGLIWASAVHSQDDSKPAGPGASFEVRPDEPKSVTVGPATEAERAALGLPAPSPQPRVDPNPPLASGAGSPAGPGADVLPTAPLRPGETATERVKRQAVQNGTTPLPTEGVGRPFSGAGAPGLPSPQPAVQAEPPALRLFKLKRANARALKEIVETLVPTSRGHVAIDASTNTLILRGPDSVFAEVEPLINELDSLEVRRADPFGSGTAKGRGGQGGSGFGGTAPGAMSGPGVGRFGGAPAGAIDAGPGGGMGGLGDPVVQQVPPPGISASDLRMSYERADKAARDLATTMKTHPYDDSQRAELRNKVAYAFSLRQTLVQLELAEMQRRIESIQESIDLRYKLTAQIVDRRVAELLDPNLQWEPATASSNRVRDLNGPGGMGGGGMNQAPQFGGGRRGEMAPPSQQPNTTPAGLPDATSPTIVTPQFQGLGIRTPESRADAAGGSGSDPINATDSDYVMVVKPRKVLTIEVETHGKGLPRLAAALVVESNATRSILLTTSWIAEPFPVEAQFAKGELTMSTDVSGSQLPVRLIATDDQLGVAILVVPTSLRAWSTEEITDVQVGDLLNEYLSRSPEIPHRVELLDQTYRHDVPGRGELMVDGAFVFDGRILSTPGSVLMKDGKLGGMFLNNAKSPSGELKSYALPAKELFERYRRLLEKSEAPVQRLSR